MQSNPDAPTELIPLVADPPTRRRQPGWWLAAGVAVALAAGGAVAVTRHRTAETPRPEETVAAATANVERRDLSTTRSLPGTVGYGPARPLSGHQQATVTWLPEPGSTIARGDQVYRADDLPVPLFYGSMPLFRGIAGRNLVGRDVQIVAENLKALGYSIGRQPSAGEWVVPEPAPATGQDSAAGGTGRNSPTDDTGPGKPAASTTANAAGSGTAAKTAGSGTAVKVNKGEGVLTTRLIDAIKRWQADLGRPVTGTIAVGDVEVLSGAIRVDSVSVQAGAPADGPLMSVTSTRKVITVSAELSDAGSIAQGDQVTVRLPDDRTVPARVVAVGRELVSPDTGPGTEAPKLTVTASVNDPRTITKIDAADVTVNFVGRTSKDVLAVPVEALVALNEGGYAVQVPGGLVAVRTGMFANGWVEITGDGLAEGTTVAVAS
ncbi:efflux RND transporter periplasmic adaptor subunit [Micromonospora sp. WMMA1363]|uniref:efflux RND transporter periplasmic adaptor subunit n=1 Tax=Micromonospora sp. WMMA1363 TaxID=3053985 RepID=UPI00259D0F07|nr:efflux RND transporter periplasmic adaptor subunit [Micromonospora sp. WMMA1363]MDM4722839.1 efflux RND transporter periplasmic adaptor subunit [Micromonospora sp. WMMA1363]